MLAAAGIGAILSPPTLGAAAFIIAEYVGVPYLQVLLWATIPTILYYVGIATGNATGVYYVLGGGLASLISGQHPLKATAAETGASVQNIQQLVAGEYDIAFSLADSAADAARGQGAFTAPQEVQALARIYSNYTHVVVQQVVRDHDDGRLPRQADLDRVPEVGHRGDRQALVAGGRHPETRRPAPAPRAGQDHRRDEGRVDRRVRRGPAACPPVA